MTDVPSGGDASSVALFQAEHHPLVARDSRSRAEYGLSLIHLKAYEFAATEAHGRTVLDVGCNNGYGTETIASTAKEVVGVDVSPTAVSAAKAASRAANCSYQVVSGERLPFDDGGFELVTSFQVIEHVENPEAYLAEIRRVLAPEGRAIFTTPNGKRRLNPGMPPWNRFHVHEYTSSELADVLGRVFASVSVFGLSLPTELDAVEAERIETIRAAQRRSHELGARLRHGAKRLIPPALLSAVRGDAVRSQARSGASIDPHLESFMARWGTADLSYRTDESCLEHTFDFTAVCGAADGAVTIRSISPPGAIDGCAAASLASREHLHAGTRAE